MTNDHQPDATPADAQAADATPPAEAGGDDFTADVILRALDECTRRWGHTVGATTFLTWLGLVRIARDQGPEFDVKITRIAGAGMGRRYRATAQSIKRLAKAGLLRVKRGGRFKRDGKRRLRWNTYTVSPHFIPDPSLGF